MKKKDTQHKHKGELKARDNVLALIARKLHNVHRDFNVADAKYAESARARIEEKFRIVDPTATSADVSYTRNELRVMGRDFPVVFQ